ncbi:MAG: outer membrane lipoprotein-sorting protein [Pseudomonadota bacterium]
MRWRPSGTAVFWRLTEHPVWAVIFSLAFIVWAAVFLGRLEKETSLRAFIPTDHPSVLAEESIEEIFGLGDAFAVYIEFQPGSSVFDTDALALIDDLTTALGDIDNVRQDRIASITTESSISGTADGVDVLPYAATPIDDTNMTSARERWLSMPPHQGTLVSFDESSALVLFELEDIGRAAETYAAVLRVTAAAERPGVTLGVAGPAAVSAYLSERIDHDARLLQPVVFLVVLLFVYLAFRRAGAMLCALVIVAGTTVGALGIMSWQGVAYYAITNALPVILVSVAVADAIHVLSHYYQLRAADATLPVRDAVVASMQAMARPIFFTSATTAAGFCGIGLASIMPPISYFAWYAALGVALAWLFSMVTLPNAMVLLNLKPSPAFESWSAHKPSVVGEVLLAVSRVGARRPLTVLGAFLLLAVLALSQAAALRFDRSQVENFSRDEPIRKADEFINAKFVGTSFLDVLVEAEGSGSLLSAAAMTQIVGLQEHMERQEHVALTVSIADYLSLLHAAIENKMLTGRELPDDDDAIGQYMFVYEASGDPTDFEEEIDASGSKALVRGMLNTVYFSESRKTVEAIQRYIDDTLEGTALRATLGGDVNTTYHWMTRLESSHFKGVALSLCMVLLLSIAVFRSVSIGLVAVVPVTFTVLLIYAVMASLDIYLEPATSMFAAISVGLGVDFAIHLIDRLRQALASEATFASALELAIPPTGRACFFNIVALGLGFSVLTLSGLPMLQRFGGMVALAAFASFIAALLVVPSWFALMERMKKRPASKPHEITAGVVLLIAAVFASTTGQSYAATPTPEWVAQQIADRAEAPATRRLIDMTLTNRRGRSKERQAMVLKLVDTSRSRMTRISFLAPSAIRNTTFLSVEHEQDGEGRWLYLPATKRVRRIPSSDRGDHFLGTDFSYEDIQSELKFDLDDYDFALEPGADSNLYTLLGQTKSASIAKELGFERFTATIDPASFLPRRIEFFKRGENPFKVVEVRKQAFIDGYWTATEIFAEHLQNRHSTLFEYREVTYPDSLDPRHFDPASLERALPAALLQSP